jgi:peptide/nickel transport system permease protein
VSAPVYDVAAALPPSRNSVLRRLVATPFGRLGLSLVLIIVIMAVFADWIAPYNPASISIPEKLQAPSFAHFFGTDQLGRDVFSRVVLGARVALEVAFASISLAIAIGGTLGLVAGYGSRWLDNVIVLVFDTIRSFPTIMFALALVTLIGPSLETVIVIVVATFAPGYGRIVRTQTQALKHAEFVLAERSLGAGVARILAVHILPNIVGPLFILASMDVPVVITIEAGLSFLGFGVRPPTPSWGSVLNDGYAFIGNTPWLILAGGLPLVLSTLGFTFLGEALRDAIDPRLRREL